MSDNAVQIARLEVSMENFEHRMKAMEDHLEKIETLVVELKSGQDKFKGAYAILGVIVAVAGGIGSLVTWALQHIALK